MAFMRTTAGRVPFLLFAAPLPSGKDAFGHSQELPLAGNTVMAPLESRGHCRAAATEKTGSPACFRPWSWIQVIRSACGSFVRLP